LQHPGIPAVYELGELPDGRPFLAMKLVKGRTLHELLKERSEPSQERGRFLAMPSAMPTPTTSFTATSSRVTSWWARMARCR
jgi:serine/threonine protein kinase